MKFLIEIFHRQSVCLIKILISFKLKQDFINWLMIFSQWEKYIITKYENFVTITMWDLQEDNLFFLLGGSFRQKQERYSEAGCRAESHR